MPELITNIDYLEDNIIAKVALQGYINPSNIDNLKSTVTELINNNVYLILLDLQKVKFVASNAWKTLKNYKYELEKLKGDIKILKMQDDVEIVFALLGYDKVFQYFKNEDNAINSFKNNEFTAYEIDETSQDKIKDFSYILDLSTEDKIKKILSTYGKISIWQVKKILDTPMYSRKKNNIFKVFLLTKKIKKRGSL